MKSMINLTWQLWLGHGTTPRQSGLCSILAETEASIWSVVAKHVRVKPGLHLFVSQQQILLEMNSPTSATRRLPFLLWASVQSCQPGKKALPITTYYQPDNQVWPGPQFCETEWQSGRLMLMLLPSPHPPSMMESTYVSDLEIISYMCALLRGGIYWVW